MLRTSTFADLALEAVIPASASNEKELHSRFSEGHIRREWFNITPEIEALIALFPIGLRRLFVSGGMNKPTISELMEKVGISKSYACEILGEKKPSRPLAIAIFRETGWRHDRISNLTDQQLAAFEAVEPWVPASERAA